MSKGRETSKTEREKKKMKKKMNKKTQKLVENIQRWKENNFIYKEWEHEDYDNVMVYEDINGFIYCIEKDENGNIIDAWED
jgi:hypothetical protein